MKKSASKESVVHGNRRATCHIDNRRSLCIREGKGCRGVAHVGHAISAAGHCLLFVAHVQLERNSRGRPCNESYFLACIPHAGDARWRIKHARVPCVYTRAPNAQHCTDNRIYQTFQPRAFFAYIYSTCRPAPRGY